MTGFEGDTLWSSVTGMPHRAASHVRAIDVRQREAVSSHRATVDDTGLDVSLFQW